jgi:hypothetical protein
MKSSIQVKQILKYRPTIAVVMMIIGILIYLNGKRSGEKHTENVLNKSALTIGVITNIKIETKAGYIVSYHFSLIAERYFQVTLMGE